jgi:osmotically-inducible protein OsmY
MNCQEDHAMLRFSMLHSAVTAGCLLWASTALAQFTQNNSGGSSGYGAFGNRTIGGGTNPGTSGFSAGASSSVGGSSMSSGGMGGNSMGAGSMGTGTTGGSQLGGSPTQGFQLGSSLSSAQQRSTAGFVGADNSDAGNLRSMQAQQNQMSSLQNAFSQFSRQNQQRNQNQNRNQNQQNNKKQLRISIKADIPLVTSATAPTSLGRVFEARLKKLPGLEKGNSIQVSMEGRTAVLTGSVASDRDRKLAEGLALLEPGISAVQNELVVADAASKGEELPAPRR